MKKRKNKVIQGKKDHPLDNLSLLDSIKKELEYEVDEK